jgi:hypothetical protein
MQLRICYQIKSLIFLFQITNLKLENCLIYEILKSSGCCASQGPSSTNGSRQVSNNSVPCPRALECSYSSVYFCILKVYIKNLNFFILN